MENCYDARGLYAITKGKYCEFVGNEQDCKTWLKENGYGIYVYSSFPISITLLNKKTDIKIQTYISYCFEKAFDDKTQVANGM